MKPACQQRAQCFSGQRWRLERGADPATVQAKRGGEREGRRAKGSKGERVVFLGLSQGGNVAQTVFCNSHGHLGLTKRALVAYCVCQTQHINTSTKAQSTPTCKSIYFFTSHKYGVTLMQRASMFSQSERCCATVFFPMQVVRPRKSTDKHEGFRTACVPSVNQNMVVPRK